MINPNSVKQQDLSNAFNNTFNDAFNVSNAASLSTRSAASYVAADATSNAWSAYTTAHYATWCLYYCSQIQNINMNLIYQYLQTLLRKIKQFNTENSHSKTIEQIIKQNVDKLELVDYNMLLDISNEHYNIDLSEFNYDNIFSRRNLIEIIRREYYNE